MTHHAEPTPGTLPFTEDEWKQMQQDDIQGGGTVVGLMAGIFTVGLVLYSVVLWSVMSG